VKFEVISSIKGREQIAKGAGVKIRRYLRKAYGPGRWRKLKGIARIRLPNGVERNVELHRYEAQRIGKRDIKIKRYLDNS
jgi:hypothetical protein